MAWIWIVVAIVFISGGSLSALMNGARRARDSAIIRAESRSYVGVNGFTSTPGGVTFGDVEPPGSPADLAGLVGGDIVTSFDGHPVRDEGTIAGLLRQTPPGKTVEIEYLRDGEARKTQLTTVSSEQFSDLNRQFSARPEGVGKLGFDTDNARRVPVPGTKMYGVQLGNGVNPSGPAILAGIEPTDIIISFDEVPIRTVSELVSRVHRAIPYSIVQFVVVRGDEQVKIPVKLGK
jgi:S1-C subfamily serine protease